MAKETKPDSLTHHEERRAKMKQESEAQTKALLEGGTREQLLDQIRAMRNEGAQPEPPSRTLTPAEQSRLNLEQEAGRRAVAEAREREATRLAEKAEGEKNRA